MSKKYDVEEVLEEFLLKGKEPLINGLISGRKFALFRSPNIANPMQLRILSFISATLTSSTPRPLRSKP